MLLYILKSSVCLALLYVFYKVFLEKENMHTFKRFYLLAALLTAFIIPFITFVQYVEIPTTSQVIEQSNAIIPIISNSEPQQYPTDYLSLMLWSTFVIGVIIFGFKFIKNLFGIILKIRINPKHRINQITNVLLLDNIIPHTFFNYIFLNKHKFEAKEIPIEVLLHEETHAKQKHSLDVLFIEVLQVLFWFNPLMYFMKKAIKLNHEFLADREVLDYGIKPSLYQSILLEFSSNSLQPQLANSINYSSIKKRFTVMKKQTSKKSLLLRSLLLIMLVSSLVYGFSQKKILEIHPENNQEILGTWIEEEQELNELSIKTQEGNLFWGYMGSEVLHFEEINGKYYYFTYDDKTKYPVIIDSEKGTLTFDKRKFVLKEKSLKEKLIGNWENKKEGVRFNVHHSGNEIVWDVIKADGKPTRYYPKKLDGRYAFTYGKELELWSFKTENGILYDSQGQSYNRVQELQSEEIFVKIDKNGQLLVQEKNRVAIEYLKGLLLNFNTELTKEQRSNIVRAVIMPDADAPTSVINKVEAILSDYGVAQIDIIGLEKYANPNQEIRVQKGATKSQIREYNALALKYNRELSNAKDIRIKKSEVERLEYLHELMTQEQKENAQPFPDFPEPPPAPAIAPKEPKKPKAPKVNKGVKSNIPPPPSPPNHNEVEVADKVIEEIIANQDPYDLSPMAPKVIKGELGTIPPNAPVVHIGEVSDIQPPPAQAPVIATKTIKASNNRENNVPSRLSAPVVREGKVSDIPPPPPPKSPMDHVVEMAKKDAVFYYEGKKISSDKAIAILKTNNKINLRTKHEGLKKPIVELSTKPIIIKK